MKEKIQNKIDYLKVEKTREEGKLQKINNMRNRSIEKLIGYNKSIEDLESLLVDEVENEKISNEINSEIEEEINETNDVAVGDLKL